MRSILAICFATCLLSAQAVNPQSYKRFNADLILIKPNEEMGTGPAVNGTYLDQWIDEIAIHARNYPVSFANDDDKNQASKDATFLIKILDMLNETPVPNPEFLRRAGFVNSMAHNLDIPGAAKRANEYFQKLLKLAPEDPLGNYMYGAFLGGVGKAEASVPFLLKADSLGISIAPYSLGMAYLMTGDNKKSIEYFEKYLKLVPDDSSVQKIIEAIKAGRVGVKHVDSKP